MMTLSVTLKNSAPFLVAAMSCLASQANAAIITFDELVHGRVVDNQYQISHGVTINTTNTGGGPNLGVAFDTSLSGTRDADLESPWSGGNLPVNTDLGRVLIIQENGVGVNDGIADLPDDEGTRPAGYIDVEFSNVIDYFGFDMIDVEGPAEYTSGGYVATFMQNNTSLFQVSFGDFVNSSSAYYDPSVVFGNNTINRFNINLAGMDVDKIKLNFGGSAAVDNLSFEYTTTVPEPSTLLLFSLSLLALGSLKRKQIRKK